MPVGEAGANEVRVAVGDVHEGRVRAGALQFVVDGASHDVAGGQVLHRVLMLHEGVARLVAEQGALAPECLADQVRLGLGVVQAGGVELEELHVGERGACPVRHRHPVSRRDVGIAGVQVDLARPSGGEESGARSEALHVSILDIEHVGAESAIRARQPRAAGRQQIDGAVVFQQGDVRMRAGPGQKRALDLPSRGIPVVEDPANRVTALAPERELRRARRRVATLPIELDAQLSQGLDRGGAAFHDEADHLLAAEAGAGRQGVLGMGLERILVGDHRRDAPLREVGRRLDGLLLGHHRHSAVLCDAQRVEETGDTAAQHEKIGIAVS